MNSVRPILVSIFGFVTCTVVFHLAASGKVFGKNIDKVFPCQQNPAHSFPCFARYDFIVMGMALIVGLLFLSYLLVLGIRYLRHV